MSALALVLVVLTCPAFADSSVATADNLASELAGYLASGADVNCRVNGCELVVRQKDPLGRMCTYTAQLSKMRPMYSVRGEHDRNLRIYAVAGSPVRIMDGDKVSYADHMLVPVPDEYHRQKAGGVLISLIEKCGGVGGRHGSGSGGGSYPKVKVKGEVRSNIMIYSGKP